MHLVQTHTLPAEDDESFAVSERHTLMDKVNAASYPRCVCVGVIDASSSFYFLLGSCFQTLRLLDNLKQTIWDRHSLTLELRIPERSSPTRLLVKENRPRDEHLCKNDYLNKCFFYRSQEHNNKRREVWKKKK